MQYAQYVRMYLVPCTSCLAYYIRMHPYASTCIRHASVCTHVLPRVSVTLQNMNNQYSFSQKSNKSEGGGESDGEGEAYIDVLNTTCKKQDYLLYIAYRLPIDFLLIALDAHMFSHNGYGPGPRPRAQKLRAPRPRPSSFWASILVPGPT